MDFDTFRESVKIYVFFIVINHSQIGNAHRLQLCYDLRRRQTTVMVLATCHRNRIIIKDFVGDIGIVRQRRPYRHNARVVVRAVPQILENMVAGRKRCFAYPIGTFAAHMRETKRLAVHPLDHKVTAYPCISTRSLRHFGR